MIRCLPTNHPAQSLNLNRSVKDWMGQHTTLSALEQDASECPTFANVQRLFAALDTVYPYWKDEVMPSRVEPPQWRYMTEVEEREIYGYVEGN